MVILSKKTRYALHGVGYIAAFAQGKPVPFDDILTYLKIYSRELTLSPGYIARIFHSLSKAGVIRAISGPRGGYSLARPARQIALVEVVEALEGPLLGGCCLQSGADCPMHTRCGVSDVLHQAEMSFYRFLEKHTIGSMTSRMAFPDMTAARKNEKRRLKTLPG